MKFVPVQALRSEIGRGLWRWYVAQVPEAEIQASVWPARDSFRPEDLPARILPHLGVVDVERDPFRVYYRLIGSSIAASLGRSHIQGYLDEMDLPQGDDLMALYRHTLEVNRPVFLSGAQQIDGQEFTYEGGALPLGAPADPVRRYIIFEDYLQTDAWRSALRQRRYRPETDKED